MSDWLKIPAILILAFSASSVSLFGSFNIKTNIPLNGTSNHKAPIVNNPSSILEENDFSESNTISSYSKLSRTTLKNLQKLPLKILTLFLAVQSSIIPAASAALSVTNLNQTLYYKINGSAIPFLPFVITSSSARMGFDIGVTMNAGSISTTAWLPLVMSASNIWSSATINKSFIDELAEKLFFTPTQGFKDVVIAIPEFAEASPPYSIKNGYITINPVSSLPATTPSTTPRTSSTTSQIQNSSDEPIDSSSSTRTQSDGLTTTSDNSAGTTFALSPTTEEGLMSSHSSGIDPSMPDSSSSDSPPYAIIGGVVGGAIVFIGAIAGAVLYKLHQKRNRGSLDAMSSLPRAPVVDEAGQNKEAVQYDVLPEGALSDPQYDILPKHAVPNQYDVVKTPHNQYDDVDTPLNL